MKPLEHVEPQKLEHGHANAWTRRWERVFAVPWMHGVGLGTYGTERYFAALVALAVWHLAVLAALGHVWHFAVPWSRCVAAVGALAVLQVATCSSWLRAFLVRATAWLCSLSLCQTHGTVLWALCGSLGARGTLGTSWYSWHLAVL